MNKIILCFLILFSGLGYCGSHNNVTTSPAFSSFSQNIFHQNNKKDIKKDDKLKKELTPEERRIKHRQEAIFLGIIIFVMTISLALKFPN